MSHSLLFRCRSLYDDLDRYLDGEMGLWERLQVKGHLMMCPKCRVYLAQYDQIRTLSSSQERPSLPPDFDRVMSSVVTRWKQEQREEEQK
jgi:anti-sigma factor RsiW